MDQVTLPAPEASPARPPSLALRALVSVGLLVGLFVVAFAIVIGLVGLNLLVLQTGRVLVALVVVTGAVVLSVGRGLVVMLRKAPEPEGEVDVPASEEPELHECMRRLAETVGTRPPDRVVVTQEVNAYVREFGPLMGLLRGTRTLAIGTPLLDVLTVAQLEAVLAHELGHLAGGDTRLGPLAFRTDQATMQMVRSLRGRAVASVFVAYWRFQHRVSASVRRGQEVVADRAAVGVAGRQAAADALQRVELTGRAEAVYHHSYLVPLLESGCRPADLAGGLRELLSDPERVSELEAASRRGDDEPDPWATHPPTAERIARLAALADPPGIVPDTRPARVLLRNPDRWAKVAHETWLELVVHSPAALRVVTWDGFAEETAGRTQRSRAAEVDEALSGLGLPPGLDGLRTAIDGGRGGALAGELIAAGWRAPGVDERTAILTAAVVAAAARAVSDRGIASLRSSWSESVVLRGADGKDIPVGELARQAAAGSWQALDAVLDGGRRSRPLRAARSLEPASFAAPAAAPRAARSPRSSALPEPPCPPYEPSSGPWLWQLEMSGHLRGKTRMAVSQDAVAFDKTVVPYDEIESVSLGLVASTDLRLTIKLGLSSGRSASLRSAAVGSDGKQRIEAAIDYSWALFSARVGPRLRAQTVGALEDGGEVKLGGVTLSRSGITYREMVTKQVSWDQVVDARVTAGVVHVVLATGRTVERPLASANAFLLVDLIPELRARFG